MALMREALKMARSQPVSSVVTLLIVAAICGAILSTTGQTVQAEQQVLAQIDLAGTRSIVVGDTNGVAGISPEAVDRIAQLSGVEWVVGLGPARDSSAAVVPGGELVAVRRIYGQLPDLLQASSWPLKPGSGLVGPEAQRILGMVAPVGGVTGPNGIDVAIVGWFEASEPLSFLNRSVIEAPVSDDPLAVLRAIHILAERPDQVEALAAAVLSVLDPVDPSSVGIETSAALVEIRSAVEGELGRFGRSLVLAVLGAGLVLVALNVYGAVTSRRRDFGRRRALGASRSAVVALVTGQVLCSGLAGALLGSAAGSIVVWRLTGRLPAVGFTSAVAILSVLSTVVAAIPPAFVAAHRDPVRVLRVP